MWEAAVWISWGRALGQQQTERRRALTKIIKHSALCNPTLPTGLLPAPVPASRGQGVRLLHRRAAWRQHGGTPAAAPEDDECMQLLADVLGRYSLATESTRSDGIGSRKHWAMTRMQVGGEGCMQWAVWCCCGNTGAGCA